MFHTFFSNRQFVAHLFTKVTSINVSNYAHFTSGSVIYLYGIGFVGSFFVVAKIVVHSEEPRRDR